MVTRNHSINTFSRNSRHTYCIDSTEATYSDEKYNIDATQSSSNMITHILISFFDKSSSSRLCQNSHISQVILLQPKTGSKKGEKSPSLPDIVS